MAEYTSLRLSLSPHGCLLLAILSVTLVFYARLRNNRRLSALGSKAPQVRSLLPFGLDTIARTIYDTAHHRDLESWQAFFTPHGPNCETVQATLLGLRCVFTNDAENIKAILATQFEDFGKGSRFHDDWVPFLGDSIFTTDGAQWRASRQLIRPQFIKHRVSDLSLFERHVQVLLGCITDIGNGARVDVNDLFLRYTLDTATEFLFGKSIDSLNNPRDEFAKAFAEVQRVQNMITKAGPANLFIPRSSYHASLKIIDGFVGTFIDQALSSSLDEKEVQNAHEYTFLHALAEFTQDRKVLRDQIIAVLLAGRDTTAAALSWTFFELAQHPEVVEKLRDEIIQVIGLQRHPTYDDLKSMKYLQNVLNEILRLYPSIPFNLRVALRDTSLPRGGGPSGLLPVGVVKDTLIGYSVLSLHRKSERDLDFAPERWDENTPTPWTYLPFNGGPRICVGQQFALAEMGYAVTRMLQHFDRVENLMPEEHHGQHPKGYMKSEIVLQPTNGVHIGLWRS